MTPVPYGSVTPHDLLALLAAAGGAGTDLTALINLGAVGVVAAILIAWARTVVKRDADRAEAAYRRETERGDRLEAENTRLNTHIQEEAIPALLAAATAIKECTELLRDLQRDRRGG